MFRSIVFKRAHYIKTTTGKTFSASLKMAWKLYRLKKLLKNNIVNFTYLKADGSIRTARGTIRVTKGSANSRPQPKEKVFTYFDMDKKQYRNFRTYSLISVC